MRAGVDERDTNDLLQEVDDMRNEIVEKTTALMRQKVVLGIAGDDADEARLLVMEIQQAIHLMEEAQAEITARGH